MRALGKYFVSSLYKRKVRLGKKCDINQDEDRYSAKCNRVWAQLHLPKYPKEQFRHRQAVNAYV
jgi:hypothetical protein